LKWRYLFQNHEQAKVPVACPHAAFYGGDNVVIALAQGRFIACTASIKTDYGQIAGGARCCSVCDSIEICGRRAEGGAIEVLGVDGDDFVDPEIATPLSVRAEQQPAHFGASTGRRLNAFHHPSVQQRGARR
jgi:hypothetical protein